MSNDRGVAGRLPDGMFPRLLQPFFEDGSAIAVAGLVLAIYLYLVGDWLDVLITGGFDGLHTFLSSMFGGGNTLYHPFEAVAPALLLAAALGVLAGARNARSARSMALVEVGLLGICLMTVIHFVGSLLGAVNELTLISNGAGLFLGLFAIHLAVALIDVVAGLWALAELFARRSISDARGVAARLPDGMFPGFLQPLFEDSSAIAVAGFVVAIYVYLIGQWLAILIAGQYGSYHDYLSFLLGGGNTLYHPFEILAPALLLAAALGALAGVRNVRSARSTTLLEFGLLGICLMAVIHFVGACLGAINDLTVISDGVALFIALATIHLAAALVDVVAGLWAVAQLSARRSVVNDRGVASRLPRGVFPALLQPLFEDGAAIALAGFMLAIYVYLIENWLVVLYAHDYATFHVFLAYMFGGGKGGNTEAAHHFEILAPALLLAAALGALVLARNTRSARSTTLTEVGLLGVCLMALIHFVGSLIGAVNDLVLMSDGVGFVIRLVTIHLGSAIVDAVAGLWALAELSTRRSTPPASPPPP